MDAFDACRIVVIGDVMLDCYLWGEVKRISPEAPVPVFQIRKRSEVLGGAGNVVRNLDGLGVSSTLIGIRGNDDNGEILLGMFANQRINPALITDHNRP
ncbi:MAG: D-glycero-beta-D-manno-heptose-7-phosphate kinase, partial [Proteobacteria bacterium]|nr:D-glycero-beta-D-manno-heptose-7-phosphate kinase [Pseudomonadota bacterium]